MNMHDLAKEAVKAALNALYPDLTGVNLPETLTAEARKSAATIAAALITWSNGKPNAQIIDKPEKREIK